ncbi:MAG: DUF4278 domain-containing protein [Cyanobacteria bacterium P01_F01_bin.86]
MPLKYRGITYQPSAASLMPSERSGIYRGIPFRTVSGQPQARSQSLQLTYRGIRYNR